MESLSGNHNAPAKPETRQSGDAASSCRKGAKEVKLRLVEDQSEINWRIIICVFEPRR